MTRLKFTTCPWCGHKLHLTSAVVEKGTIKPGDEEPYAKTGDAGVCSGCGMMSIFDDSLRDGMRFPTKKEWDELQGEKVMAAALVAVATAAKEIKKPMRPIKQRPEWMSFT